MIVVIDGPAASGKSSTARAVARKMDIEYLDSGALYRAVTLLYIRSSTTGKPFPELLDEVKIRFTYDDGVFYVYVDDRDVTGEIRSISITENVSKVASDPMVRKFVNNLMREVVDNGRYIAEGRDLGTAVFPDADLKFYMTANVETRAERRYHELIEQGKQVSLEEVKNNIRRRDRKDQKRNADPLKKADDAIEVDTTNYSFEQQVDFICSHIKELNNKQ